MSIVNTRDVPDIVMMALLGLVSGEDLVVRDGDLHLLSGGVPLWVGAEVLDVLTLTGWAVVPALPPGTEPGTRRECVPTPRGREAVADWLRRRFRGRRVDVSRLRPAKLTARRGA